MMPGRIECILLVVVVVSAFFCAHASADGTCTGTSGSSADRTDDDVTGALSLAAGLSAIVRDRSAVAGGPGGLGLSLRARGTVATLGTITETLHYRADVGPELGVLIHNRFDGRQHGIINERHDTFTLGTVGIYARAALTWKGLRGSLFLTPAIGHRAAITDQVVAGDMAIDQIATRRARTGLALTLGLGVSYAMEATEEGQIEFGVNHALVSFVAAGETVLSLTWEAYVVF